MNNLEQKYVDEVNAYLALPVAEREIEKGAMLMLKGNRNQTLHKTVIRKIWHEKVEYELKKILGERLIVAESQVKSDKDKDKNPFDTVSIAETEVLLSNHMTKANEIEVKGKRADHDQLPEEIQSIPDANKVRYQKMRSLHEKLKLMNAENFTAEDRKPVLDEFIKLDGDLRLFWNKYDAFVIGNNTAVTIDAKRIQSNRTHFSRITKKDLLNEKEIADTQIRYDEMTANKVVISPEITEKLKALGIKTVEVAPETLVVPVPENKEESNNEVIPEAAAPAPENMEENNTEVILEAPIVPAPENKEETENTEVNPDASSINAPENNENEKLSEEDQQKAEAILSASIKGMLKSNLATEVIKTAFSSVEKVGDKDLTPEFLQELIDAATAELIDVDLDAQV